MKEELKKVFELLNAISVTGYGNVKRLSMAMDVIAELESKITSGELVVRRREEMKHGTEDCRQTD